MYMKSFLKQQKHDTICMLAIFVMYFHLMPQASTKNKGKIFLHKTSLSTILNDRK